MLSSFGKALQGLTRLAAASTRTGLWFVQLGTQGQGVHSVFLSRCPGTSLAFTLTLIECPHHARGGGFQMTGAIITKKKLTSFSINLNNFQMLCMVCSYIFTCSLGKIIC